jgi:hypothetical protein
MTRTATMPPFALYARTSRNSGNALGMPEDANRFDDAALRSPPAAKR